MKNHKKTIKNSGIVMVANFILFCIGMAFALRGGQEDVIIDNVPLFCNDEIIDSDNVFSADYQEAWYRFEAKTEKLKKGVYTVTISYQTNGDSFFVECAGSGAVYPSIYVDDHYLKADKSVIEFNFWANGGLDSFTVDIDCGNVKDLSTDVYLRVEKIEICRDYKATVIYEMLKILMALVVINLVALVYIKRTYIKENFYVIAGLGIIVLISSLGVFMTSQIRGHDLLFHLARIQGLAEGMLDGDFPVKMQPGWFNGYGSPIFCYVWGHFTLYTGGVVCASCASCTCI